MYTRPLLTLCIPTFNRAAYLRARLEEIAAYLPMTGREDIQILVSDNGSSDNTASTIAQFSSRLTIDYHRLPTNYGVDLNLFSCMTKARGEYLWLFGDDDSFLEGSFTRVLRELRKGCYSTLIINQLNGDNLRSQCPVFVDTLHPAVTDEEDSLQNLYHRYSFLSLLGNISGIIFKRPELHPFDWSRHAAYKTGFAHTSVIFETLQHRPALLIAEPLFCSNPPPEHLTFEHRKSRESELDFRNWTLNLSGFLSEMLEKGIIARQQSSNFFNVIHIGDSMMTHILMAFQGQMLSLSDIPSTHWEKAERFAAALGIQSYRDKLRALRALYEAVMAGVRSPAISEQIRSTIHWHSERIIRSQGSNELTELKTTLHA